MIRSIVRRKRNTTPLSRATPTSPGQVLRHEVAEALLVGCPQPKVGIGVGQSLGATVILEAKPPDVVLRLLQLLFSVLDADLTPASSDHLPLEGAVPNPGHGVVDVVAKGMVEIEKGELCGGIGANGLVSVVRGGMNVLEVGMGVVVELPIDNGIVCPLDLDVVCLLCAPPWERDLEIDEIGPLV